MHSDATLGMIAGEVERSFDEAAAALQRHRNGLAGADVLEEARRAIEQVRGALEVADVAGVPRVLSEVEHTLAEAAEHPDSVGERLARSCAGLDAVRRYVSALAAGSAPQPMALATVLQDLLAVRGLDRPAGLELFEVDLSRPLPDDLLATQLQAGHADRAVALRGLRATFQKLLLEWLRGGASALESLGEIIGVIQPVAPAPAPWWIAGAFVEQLRRGVVPASVHVKRVFAGLDQHLSRLIAGDAAQPQALMREMLYFISLGGPADAGVERVRGHYAVAAALPAPAAPRAEFAERLSGLEHTWEAAAAGDAASAGDFIAGLDQLRTELPQALQPLIGALRNAAERIATGAAVDAVVALEAAIGLLCLQDASVNPLDPERLARIEPAVARLRKAIDGGADAAGKEASYTGLVSKRSLEAALGTQLVAAIGRVEQRLAAYFAHPADLNALADAERALVDVHGGLQILGEDHPATAAGHCIVAIGQLRASATALDRQTQAELAAIVSALSFYAGCLGREQADFGDVLRKAGAPETVCAWPQPEQPVQTQSLDLDLTLAVDDAETAATPNQEIASPAGAVSDDASWDIAADADLLAIFIDESVQVLDEMGAAVGRLRGDPRDSEALAVLRRGFHTLKGSGRMVGLQRIGDVAQALERLFDAVIRGDRDPGDQLVGLIDTVLARFSAWMEALRGQGRIHVETDALFERIARLPDGAAESPPTQAVAAAPGIVDPPTVEIGGVRLSRTLFDVFIDEARRTVQALLPELSEIDRPADDDRTHERFRLAHTLSGISGTTGFEAVHELGGALEAVLRGVHEHELRVDASDRALFESVGAALSEMVDAVERGEAPRRRADLEAALHALAQRELLDADDEEAQEPPGATDAVMPPAPIGRALRAAVKVLAEQLSETGVLDVVPLPHAERRRLRIEDDLDAALLPAFLEEAADLMPQIGDALRRWRADPQDGEPQQALTRLLHTFKGGARMAGAMALGELTHSMETRIATAMRLPVVPDSVFDGLEASFDRMGILMERVSRPMPADDAVGAEATVIDAAVESTMLVDSTSPEKVDQPIAAESAVMPAPPADAESQRASAADAAPARPLLRVRVDLLERLAMEAGELAISRARVEGEVRVMRGALREMASSIGRLRTQVREMEIQAESQIQSRQLQARESEESMDPLEFDRFTRLQELTRLVDESANDVASLQLGLTRNVDGCDGALAAQARMTRLLQDSLVSVRMVPFASLNERLYRVVRLTARDAGRRASLDIRGSRVELDRSVVDRIAAPIEHLLRNAVVHGIESAEERLAAGKPEAGEIVLEIRQEGNEVLLALQDDGRGLDVERLRERAFELGLLAADCEPTAEQIVQVAFAPGVSTASSVSESAGRGVGLDVVRSEVAAVGGRVEVEFEPRRGTVFTIRLPLTMTVMQALIVRCAGQLFALPAMMVEQVRTLKAAALERVRESGQVDWQANRYPFHDLRDLLAIAAGPAEPQAFTPLALVRGGMQRAAIRIDELVAHEEVVMKELGRQLAGVTGIVGAAVRGSGEIVLIVNPVRLTQRQPVAWSGLAAPATPMHAGGATAPSILVVDDSLTVRKITGRVLARNGYRVQEARDGLEALDRLAVERPTMVLLDIEMPRMDGFEVLRRLRSDPRWKDLPVMMITSRTAEKHRNHAMELGASAFLGKPFEEQELLAQLSMLLERERA